MKNVVAIANQKGGIGKTTTTQALAAGLSAKGYRVLAIDSDPQGNLTFACGAEYEGCPTLYHVMRGMVDAGEAVQHVPGGFDLIPANIMLSGAEREFIDTGKEHLLEESISPIAGNYDFIVIDTPPSLGTLTINALTFADDVLIPTTASMFAANGIGQLNGTVANVRKYCNPEVKIIGILITRYSSRANISKELCGFTEKMGEYISAPIYKTHIRAAVAIEEAQAVQEDIFNYSTRANVAEDYRAFVDEFLERRG